MKLNQSGIPSSVCLWSNVELCMRSYLSMHGKHFNASGILTMMEFYLGGPVGKASTYMMIVVVECALECIQNVHYNY